MTDLPDQLVATPRPDGEGWVVELAAAPPPGAGDLAKIGLLACTLAGVLGAICCPIGLGALIGLAFGVLAVPPLIWMERRNRAQRLRLSFGPDGLDGERVDGEGTTLEQWRVRADQVQAIDRVGDGLVVVHTGGLRRTELRMGGHPAAHVDWVAAQLAALGYPSR